MSFTGDLEHLPIVDVIQLLHSTRKSGTLCVKGGRGESQLVFNDGYIVSANHSNNAVRIGKILVDMNAITPDVLEKTLLEQKNAGGESRPIIDLLIENHGIEHEVAFKGLETLIEMTVVEMLRLSEGSFTLNVDNIEVSDEYRYFPEILKKEITLDTQMVLLDALRIFDEKNRDGEFDEDEFSSNEDPLPMSKNEAEESPSITADEFGSNEDPSPMPKNEAEESPSITADDLGLGDLDLLERKIPEVFPVLETFDPEDIHRRKIRETLPDASITDQEALVSYLMSGLAEEAHTPPGHAPQGSPAAIILFSRDELLKHCILTAGKVDGIIVFTTDEVSGLDQAIAQTLSKGISPILFFDCPEQSDDGFSREAILRTKLKISEQHPQLQSIQLINGCDFSFLRQAITHTAAILPRPLRPTQKDAFVSDLIGFLEAFRAMVSQSPGGQGSQALCTLKRYTREMRGLSEASDLSFALLRGVSETFERAITLIVRKTDLIAERAIGVNEAGTRQASAALKFTIPLAAPSIFKTVVNDGYRFYGESDDALLNETLFKKIAPPLRPNILLLPVICRGKVITIIYCDFGSKDPTIVQIDTLEILARQAGLKLENSLYRKQLEKFSQQR